MKVVGITGGKGGTGKSTFSVLLADKLRKEGKKVILLDCDVECPNDYLLLGIKLGKATQKVFAQFSQLDEEKCLKCGLCSKKCRSNAIFQAPNKYPIFLHEFCSGCGLCWHLCPQKAIGIKKKLIGNIIENKIDSNFSLITGTSVGIVDETGPIVTETKNFAMNLAKKIKADYLLIDTAVGMHCGVIRALIDCHQAYAVTEPTPLGAHDLDLILQLLKKLKIPTEIVVNQYNLGKKALIDKIKRKFDTAVAYNIPYSKEIVTAYSQGKLQEVNIL